MCVCEGNRSKQRCFFFSSLVSTFKWNDILRPLEALPPPGLAGDG